MALRRLKLNDYKTEYLLILSSANSSKITVQAIQTGDSAITSTSAARNIGVVFDDRMDIGKQIVNVFQIDMVLSGLEISVREGTVSHLMQHGHLCSPLSYHAMTNVTLSTMGFRNTK